jgi:hypothetical protein
MAFFDSDIVQDEAKRLFGDYQQLMQLGSEYGKFDREGKKKFIETMEELMGRYRVFMTSCRKTFRRSSRWSSFGAS